MRKIIFAVLTIVIVMLGACGAFGSADEPAELSRDFITSDGNFSITVPDNWMKDYSFTQAQMDENNVVLTLTDNEKYFDRFFTIRGTTITFGTGNGTSESYIITDVERVPFVGDSLFTVEYSGDGGGAYRFSFFFRRGDRSRGQRDEIRLMNQRYFAWVRSP